MPIKMKISEFVSKYGDELGVNYCAIHNLIKTGKLREGVHFRRSYRGVYEKFTVIPAPLYKFLKELHFSSPSAIPMLAVTTFPSLNTPAEIVFSILLHISLQRSSI